MSLFLGEMDRPAAEFADAVDSPVELVDAEAHMESGTSVETGELVEHGELVAPMATVGIDEPMEPTACAEPVAVAEPEHDVALVGRVETVARAEPEFPAEPLPSAEPVEPLAHVDDGDITDIVAPRCSSHEYVATEAERVAAGRHEQSRKHGVAIASSSNVAAKAIPPTRLINLPRPPISNPPAAATHCATIRTRGGAVATASGGSAVAPHAGGENVTSVPVEPIPSALSGAPHPTVAGGDTLDGAGADSILWAAAAAAGATARADALELQQRIRELRLASETARQMQKQRERKRQRLADRLQGVSQVDLMMALSMAAAKG